ncbi:hypothetical protein FRZ67_15005 [Panacibacter ginsenosidivorans]|uniref:DUF5777 domain-containing protein n=1 Tax=Panacibacter ginsenosidivorans TaxID=1813871 RepID=A0A5B8VAM7_9BACT|nr:DUF5777 family beta-barrel protein [Panacibacter ginsenosidivorans]QEC68550.1 hypothetical protein FRZ67_15005 [Panacibacter ginsenosidivorans]
MYRIKSLIIFLSVFTCVHVFAQDVNLDSLLDAEMSKKTKSEIQYTDATFKTSRLINGHSVETTQPGVFDLKISHRFGTLNQGPYQLFGLDQASVRIGGDYGVTKRLTVGGGRSSFEKQYDAFLKYRLLWQSSGKRNIPLSVTLVASSILKTIKNADATDSLKRNASDRYSFAFQALIARKFSSSFSMQLMPTLVHYNIVPTDNMPNDFYSIGAGARLKLTKRSSITAEYYYQLPNSRFPNTHNSFSLGYEVETGGHVFQLHVTNSTGMTEPTFINETTGSWNAGDIHFGFNISRVFNINTKRRELPDLNATSAKNDKHAGTYTPNETPDSSKVYFVQSTFAGTHIINGQSIETTQKGILNFIILHRFGTLNSGFYNAFGLDAASMRIGFEYGITNRLAIGFGRSTFEKQYDGMLKYRLLWQSEGKRTIPLSLTLASSVNLKTLKSDASDSIKINASDRYSYSFQAILARKFGKPFSLQLMPTVIHYNVAPAANISNDVYALGAGARVRVTPSTYLTFEYYYQLPGHQLPGTYNSFSIGYEIETGGHVFQLHVTNSTGMTDRTFIAETTGRWNKGDIHFGFNISRVFVVKKAKSVNE